MTQREFTGRHALLLFGGAFTVIIAVNLLLAFSAVRTFPGLEVKNSYVASQKFNERLAEQQQLGWSVLAQEHQGQIVLDITDSAGVPVQVAALEAVLGRATHVRDDQTLDFRFDGQSYVAPVDLADGNWNIRLTAKAQDGSTFAQRVLLRVGG